MGSRQALAVALVVLGIAVAGSAVGASVSAPAQPQVNESANGTDSGFGTQVSSFMQASAADADAAVERGMWRAEVNSSENKTATLDRRTETLRQRLQRLQNRTAELTDRYGNGTGVAYDARASALRTQIRNVRTAINQTEKVAAQTGVNLTRLNELRTRAANVSGPAVSAMARNITDAPRGPPAGVPAGPPGDGSDTRGGPHESPGNGSNGAGPGQHGDHGPPTGEADRPGNATVNEPGPPGNATNATGDTRQQGGMPTNETDRPDRPTASDPGPPENATAQSSRSGTET